MTVKLGDVVRLKCGGPPMILGKSDGQGGVTCYWFEGKKEHHASFPIEALEPAQPDHGADPVGAF